jgi:serine protease Do
LTNNHVVDKADRIKVKFVNDPTEYDAKVVGVDAATDLAVIRLEGKKDFVAAKIGNSEAVQVGDWVLAIGSPLGFQATVTAGIISAKGRDIDPSMQFQHFLQTDAAINPGNSGGPLFNMNGEVIGINTAIASRSGGYQGIGFALPINTAATVYNQIIKSGKVVRGGIGIRFRNSDDSRDLLRAYGAKNGVFVQSVTPGGPADKAGVKEQDIVTAINGKPILDGNELLDRVTATPIGDSLDLTVLREGKERHVKVVVADLAQLFPETFGGKSAEPNLPAEGTQARFGISIENLSAERQKNMGLKESGVLISDVVTGSFADDIGMQGNDVLTAINRQPVKSVDDVKRIQSTLKPGDAVAFRVLRKGRGQQDWQALFLAGTLPASAQ